jgi:phosphoglycerate dehydrogenase-like enzyme
VILRRDAGRGPPGFAQTGTQALGLDELVAQADVVSLHVPLVDGTRPVRRRAHRPP